MEEKVYRSELTPVSFLARSVSVFPEKTAVVYGDRHYSYREFAERVTCAGYLDHPFKNPAFVAT